MLELLLLLNFFQCYQVPEKQVEKNGMVVTWEIHEQRIHFQMKAPTKGWVAIGLNEKDQLRGNNLIMGAVVKGVLTIEDQFISGVGVHRPIVELGGSDLLENKKGKQDAEFTTVEFSLPLKPNDSYHKRLQEGQPYYLLMAYSVSDDFGHHSIMRTTISITL